MAEGSKGGHNLRHRMTRAGEQVSCVPGLKFSSGESCMGPFLHGQPNCEAGTEGTMPHVDHG